ncbi:MAG: GNAT family N-acetyltransferase [Candidatus Hodarchaeales archaeon]
MTTTTHDVKIRVLTVEDLPAIKEIEKKIMFSRNQEHIDISVPEYMEKGSPEAKLGAEVDGKLVGFIIGKTRYWEAGWTDDPKTGWIVALGVSPEFQGKGIGKKLGVKLIEHFKLEKVSSVRCIADYLDADLISYFKALGFHKSTKIILTSNLE